YVDQHGIARGEQEGGDEVEALRRTAGDHHLRAAWRSRIGQAQAVADEVNQGRWTCRIAIGQQVRTVAVHRALSCCAQLPDRQEVRIGVSPGQVDDAWDRLELGDCHPSARLRGTFEFAPRAGG